MLSINFYISLYSRTRTESAGFPADTTSVSILLFPLHKNKCAENIKPFIDLYLVLSIKVKLLLNLCSWIWSSFITQLYMGSNLKQCFCLIANNNIRSAILEIKNDRSEIVKILNSFLISNMMLLILLFAIKLLARLSIFKCFCCFQFLLKEKSKTNLSCYLSQVISAHSSEKYNIKTFVSQLIFVTIFDRLCC